ncbi:zinc finger protein 264-like isoform X2 [Papio anubis]|uniref:zinc finger protein 264-like isoform X2 n=1 Tax=Papio anubis TaxID=9555 RepID=UPI0004F1F226|nr:zinc finger protein 264-like isoform X2 [Papio anubis]
MKPFLKGSVVPVATEVLMDHTQVLLILKYLAMIATWEEREQLDEAQKTLYGEIFVETCGLLVSVSKAHLSLMWGEPSFTLSLQASLIEKASGYHPDFYP